MSVGEEDSFEVVPKGKYHDAHEEDQPNLLSQLALAFSQRLAQDALDEEEKQVTTVENGNGQQIEHAQVDAQQSNEEDDVGRTLGGSLPGYFGDGQRPADILTRNVADDHFVQSNDRQFCPFPGGFKTVVDGRQGS